MVNKLLCATDGSHASDKAVDYAIELAQGLHADLTFLTVKHMTAEGARDSAYWDSVVLEAADAQVAHELHAAEAKARAAGLVDVKCVSISGHNIAAAIVDYAERNGHDHIVTGSVGRTGVARLLLGSIASDVVAKAHAPVTIVR